LREKADASPCLFLVRNKTTGPQFTSLVRLSCLCGCGCTARSSRRWYAQVDLWPA